MPGVRTHGSSAGASVLIPVPSSRCSTCRRASGTRASSRTRTPFGSTPPSSSCRHRGHARVEDRVRSWKDCGLQNLPFGSFTQNLAWVAASLVAGALLAWAQMTCLDGELKKAEPKTLRYRILHVARRSSCGVGADSSCASTRPGRGHRRLQPGLLQGCGPPSRNQQGPGARPDNGESPEGVTSDESTNLWVDVPYNDRIPSLSPHRQYSTVRLSFPRPDEFSRLIPGARRGRPCGGEEHPPDAVPPGRGVRAARVRPAGPHRQSSRHLCEGDLRGGRRDRGPLFAELWCGRGRLVVLSPPRARGALRLAGRRPSLSGSFRHGLYDGGQLAHRSVLQAPDDHRVARLGGASRRRHVPEPRPVLPGDRRPSPSTRRPPRRISTQSCATSRTWICALSATTSPRATSRRSPSGGEPFPPSPSATAATTDPTGRRS